MPPSLATLGLSLCRAASVADSPRKWTRDDRATMAMLLTGSPGPIRSATFGRLVSRGAINYVYGQSYWTPFACTCGRASYACSCGGIPNGGFPL